MQKENLQRLKGWLPKGQFYLSRLDVAINLEITESKAQRLITKFIKKILLAKLKEVKVVVNYQFINMLELTKKANRLVNTIKKKY